MGTRQVIEIDVTWSGYSKKLSLNFLIKWLAELGDTNTNLNINRITVREVKKR